MGLNPVEFNKIIFHSSRPYNTPEYPHLPEPASKVTPKWYQEAEIYLKYPDGKPMEYPNGGGRVLGFKSCPAILDFFTAGYMLKTPCDVNIEYKNQKYTVKIEDPQFKDFCDVRPGSQEFPYPVGHSDTMFHFWPSWAPELPKGYSAIYLSPVNHFDLPFTMVAGIIDNDQFNSPGLMPFFLKEGFSGVIPAGTPFAQIIPFRREDWEMDLEFHNINEIVEKAKWTQDTFRKPDGGVYKKLFWQRRKYK